MELETTKKVLRGLLVSAPSGGIPLGKLLKEYEELEGRPLPFEKLGYEKLGQLLNDIPDTLNIETQNGRPIVFSVTTSDNEHIGKLVAEQHHTTRKSNSRFGRPPRNRNTFRSMPNTGAFGQVGRHQTQPSSYRPLSQQLLQYHRNNYATQSNVQLQVSFLSQQFRSTQGQQPYHRNRSIPFFNNRSVTFTNSSSQNNAQFIQTIRREQCSGENRLNPQHLTSNINRTQNQSQQYYERSEQKNQDVARTDKPIDNNRATHYSSLSHQTIEQKESTVHSRLNSQFSALNIKRIQSESQQYDEKSEQKNQDNARRDEAIYAYNAMLNSSLSHVIEGADDVDTCQAHPGNGSITDSTAVIESSTVNEYSTAIQRSRHYVRYKLTRTEEIHRMIVGKKVEDLDDLSECSDNIGSDLSIADGSEDAFPHLFDDDFLYSLCRADEFITHGAYQTIKLSSLSHEKITIMEVCNPYKFWFRLDTFSLQFNDLMDLMQSFYKSGSHKKEVEISEKFLQIGLLCAVQFQWKWHRGIMVDICNIGYVIYLVDTGYVIEALSNDIRYLWKEFSKLPAQAIRGTLDFVQPKNGIWTHNTNTEFRKLVIQKSFNAKISSHSEKERTVYMQMFDRMDNLDVGNKLTEMNLVTPTKRSINHLSHHLYSDLYPSFDMIEKLHYPTYDDIEFLLSNGFDFHDYEEGNIIREMYGFVPPDSI